MNPAKKCILDSVLTGDGKKHPDSDFPKKEIQKGITVEKEHTNEPYVAKRIAKDHLDEDVEYYEKLQKMEEGEAKEAALADRKWSYLWHTGELICPDADKDDCWVLLKVHKGLCTSAYESIKSEGVECDPHYEHPHISVLRPDECKALKKQYGDQWLGAAKIGQKFRFRLEKIVSLIPIGWENVDRVWFLECASPALESYRKDLGFTKLPSKEGRELRFHITFARRENETAKAAEFIKQAESQGETLAGVFNKMEVDPDVTDATLGQRHKNVSIPMILRTTNKLLNIQNKKEETDDRDSLAFQTLHSPDDLFEERILKDAGKMGHKLLWKSTLRRNLQHIPAGALTPQVRGVLLSSGLGMPLEEINLMDVYDQSTRVLRLGEGGISSTTAIPDEARSVQPSHFGYLDPIRSPESEKIGVDSRVTYGAVKGSDNHVYTSMYNPKTNKPQMVSAQQASKSIIAFPGEMEKNEPRVRAMIASKHVEYVDRNKVDFALPHFSQMFSSHSNLVPLISGIKGGRLLMGSKYVVQALPMRYAEAPLVQSLSDDGKRSFDDALGERVGAIRSSDAGIVREVTPNGITVMHPGGNKQTYNMYNNFVFNRKSDVHNTAMVKPGDRIEKGQLLAKSNCTDDNGTLALGTNLRTAYMPYRGLNFEDAIVISESAAKKLSSEHMYQHVHDSGDDVVNGRKEFISMFPAKFKPDQIKNIGNNGVVKVGSTVKYGEPLALSLKRAETDALHRGHKPLYADNTLTWDHHNDGIVTDVEPTKEGGWNIIVKSYSPSQEGDKLSGRYGDKGVISKIVPDSQMVHDKDGKPIDILLNPLGIVSRANPSQAFETLLGKVAAKTGKPYKVPGFMETPLIDYVRDELRKNNLTDTEDLIDPVTGHKIPQVLTGNRFIMKLHHTAESKGTGRDIGGYSSEGLPARGGAEGSKQMGTMEQFSLLSHGAREVIKDSKIVRGQKNDDYWRAFRMGLTPPAPKIPFIYSKFISYLKGAGVDVQKTNGTQKIFALTPKAIEDLSSGEIKNDKTANAPELKEIEGGLFDRHITGGHGGSRWSHIQLAEKMPNPIMEEPLRVILGLTQKKMEDVIAGKETLGGMTGPNALYNGLQNVNLPQMEEHCRDEIRNGSRTRREKAIKTLNYVHGLIKSGVKPTELMWDKVPVVPPSMRPITSFNGMSLVADLNWFYKDVFNMNSSLKDVKDNLGDKHAGEERLNLYTSMKALAGEADPIVHDTKKKEVKGILTHIFGAGSPKTGMFQRRVLSSPVDVVGRAVITTNPKLSMDEVGIPENKAWVIYRPFIVRRLIRRGVPATEAAKSVVSQNDMARGALEEEIKERPVIINRAPTLHRYGFMAAFPKLVKGNTLQLPPVICAGFGADFDGDAMNYHVPVADSAVKEAVEKMLPSRNLRAVRDMKVMYLPKNEFLLGMNIASTVDNKGEPKIFKDKNSVLAAHHRGELDLGDRIIIHDDK